MSHPDEGDREHETRTLEQLAEDWITLWQTEIAGWMTDPELARMLAAWMSQGAAGDLIRVQNLTTKRFLTGRVQEDKSVLVLNYQGG